MGCGGKRLPPNGTIVQISKPRAERPKPEPPKAKKLIDYHCDQCGYSGPRAQHTCTPKPVSWIETRGKTCGRCPYAVDGVCTLYKSQHPDRDAVISIGIEMPYAACPAGLWPRVEYSCTECGSITFNERGVVRCKSCGYSPQRKVSLPHIVRLAPEKPLTPVNNLAVITLAIGQKAIDIHAITGVFMEAYAKRCGADYHVISDDQSPRYPLANKFRLETLAANYERTLFLDADVLVKSDAPDIFKSHPSGSVFIHPDAVHNYPSLEFSRREMIVTCKEQQIDQFEARMLNTGVVLFDREHVGIWAAPKLPSGVRHLAEQMHVESNIVRSGMPQRDLEPQWNWQWYFKDFDDGQANAHFIHLAACPHEERIYRLRKLAHANRG